MSVMSPPKHQHDFCFPGMHRKLAVEMTTVVTYTAFILAPGPGCPESADGKVHTVFIQRLSLLHVVPMPRGNKAEEELVLGKFTLQLQKLTLV